VFCEVFALRRAGTKLRSEQLVGIRGRLVIERGGMVVGQRDVEPYRAVTATVHVKWPPSYPGHSAATLHQVRILRLDDRGFVLAGTEVVQDGLGAHTYPQAWFCRPASPAEQPEPREPAWLSDPSALGPGQS
jgi:hypothetical protein